MHGQVQWFFGGVLAQKATPLAEPIVKMHWMSGGHVGVDLVIFEGAVTDRARHHLHRRETVDAVSFQIFQRAEIPIAVSEENEKAQVRT